MQEMSSLCKPTLNALLNGNRELSDESNNHILISVRIFLINTKRFK